MKTFLFRFLAVFAMFFMFTATAFGLTQEAEPITSAAIVSLFTGAAVWGATELVKKIAGLSGNVVLFLIVPALSLILGYLMTLIDSSSSLIVNVLIGLGSVFVDQLLSKLKGDG